MKTTDPKEVFDFKDPTTHAFLGVVAALGFCKDEDQRAFKDCLVLDMADHGPEDSRTKSVPLHTDFGTLHVEFKYNSTGYMRNIVIRNGPDGVLRRLVAATFNVPTRRVPKPIKLLFLSWPEATMAYGLARIRWDENERGRL